MARKQAIGLGDPGRKVWTINLPGEDPDDRRRIDEHQKSPDSSSKNALSAGNPPGLE